MDDPRKFIDKQSIEEQGETPNTERDPGAMPAPHSVPVSPEFERAAEDEDGDDVPGASTQGSIQRTGDQSITPDEPDKQ